MKHENLIELLKSEDRYFSKEEICEKLPNDFKYNHSIGHDVCSTLWNVKNEINNNFEKFNVVIISNKMGDLKIPTREELKEYLEREKKQCVKRFNRYWKKAKAFGLIDQDTIIGENWEIVRKG